MKSILETKKSKRKNKSDIPKFVKNNMISIKDEIPPDSNMPVLVWEEIVPGYMGFEVTNGRKAQERIRIDREHGFEPRTKFWMKLEE